jgi:hypothetical protein
MASTAPRRSRRTRDGLRELLIGDRGGRTRLLAAYAQIYQAAAVPHAELVQFVHDRRLFGRGLGWVDVHLLASAMVGRLQLWTADPRFEAAAQELGLNYVGNG